MIYPRCVGLTERIREVCIICPQRFAQKILKEILKAFMNNEIGSLYEFGEFKFDSKRGKLRRDDELILLSPKASELLKLLLERNGEYISKEEIFAELWVDTFVEDGVLTQNIYTLRKALGNNEDGSPIIENKTRLGYRITTEINKIEQTNGNQLEITNTPRSEITPIQIEKSTRNRKPTILILGAIFLLVAGFLGWFFLRQRVATFFRKPIESVKFTKLTNTGDLSNAVISPDGSLIAFTRADNVFLKDIITEKEIKIDTPKVNSFGSMQFSPDGNFLYFRNNKILQTQSEILKVSRFGGESQTVVERSWGSFSLSPDGKRIAYFLNVPPIANFNLKVRNLETGEEKEFLIAEPPHNPCLVCSPAWSPDGKKILYIVNFPNGTGKILVLNLENGNKEEIKLEKLQRFQQAAWFPDGESFVVSASDGNRFFHLWKVFYADGEAQPLSVGLSNYGKVSVSADGKKILALQISENSNLFIADSVNLNEQKQLTFGDNNFGQNGLFWIDDQQILYSVQTEQTLSDGLALLNSVDNTKTAIVSDKKDSFRVPVSDGKKVWFTRNKGNFSQVFQMDLDGKNIRQLTDGADGQRVSPRITNDSKYLFYVLRGKDGAKILRYDLQTNTEEVFFNNPNFQPGPFMELSPDNKYLTFLRMQNRPAEANEKFNAVMTVVSLENKDDIKFFPVSMIPPIRRFSPDSKSLEYILAETESTQIVRQSFDGSEPKPLFTIPEGQIFNFAWSKNGKKLAIARGQQYRDVVLLTEFDK